ncbi:MAG: glycosyltransferase family 2 protein [Lachnospiraceae bacterium]|nr:glycosyltransferase family 2 protein [Lachnospiraceae bacterium]
MILRSRLVDDIVMKIVVASVVYKGAMEYLDDFIKSISEQTNQNFAVLLLNDDMPEEYLEKILRKYYPERKNDIIIVNACGGSSISQLRVRLLYETKVRGYDFLILSDCDDKLSGNRVGNYLEVFDPDYSFYYNALLDFDGQAVMPELPAETLSWRQIAEENYLGLSNTGIWLKKLSLQFITSLNQGNTKIFDWYLYSRILLAGMRGKKVENCYTYYRIHAQNIAGKKVLAGAQVEKEILIKIEHYKLLEEEEPYLKKLRQLYEKYYEKRENLTLNDQDGFWWSLVKHEQQEGGRAG